MDYEGRRVTGQEGPSRPPRSRRSWGFPATRAGALTAEADPAPPSWNRQPMGKDRRGGRVVGCARGYSRGALQTDFQALPPRGDHEGLPGGATTETRPGKGAEALPVTRGAESVPAGTHAGRRGALGGLPGLAGAEPHEDKCPRLQRGAGQGLRAPRPREGAPNSPPGLLGVAVCAEARPPHPPADLGTRPHSGSWFWCFNGFRDCCPLNTTRVSRMTPPWGGKAGGGPGSGHGPGVGTRPHMELSASASAAAPACVLALAPAPHPPPPALTLWAPRPHPHPDHTQTQGCKGPASLCTAGPGPLSYAPPWGRDGTRGRQERRPHHAASPPPRHMSVALTVPLH